MKLSEMCRGPPRELRHLSDPYLTCGLFDSDMDGLGHELHQFSQNMYLCRWMCSASAAAHLSAEDGSVVKDRGSRCGAPGSNLSSDGAAGMCHSAGFCVCLSNKTKTKAKLTIKRVFLGVQQNQNQSQTNNQTCVSGCPTKPKSKTKPTNVFLGVSVKTNKPKLALRCVVRCGCEICRQFQKSNFRRGIFFFRVCVFV